ncbi:MAG: PH domain-containing protein [Planctomycetota bacterium]
MSETKIRQLDPGWVRLERTIRSVVLTVFTLVTGVIGFFLHSSWLWPWNWVVPMIWLLILSIGFFVALVLPALSYRRWSYQVDERVIQLKRGIVWRAVLAIPVSRLQHVDLHRGPIERRFGLTSLEIHTAGTRAASHLIPGLENDVAVALRDELIDAANRGANVNATG